MDIKRKDIVVIRSNKILMFCFSCVFIFALISGFAYGQIRIAPLEQSTNSQWLEGATLKTDSSVDELMVRAEQFSKQGRYDLASSLWQTVIDSSNDLVFSNDEWIEKTLSHQYELYRSVSGEIEDALSALPIEGIKGYRLNADAEAKELDTSEEDSVEVEQDVKPELQKEVTEETSRLAKSIVSPAAQVGILHEYARFNGRPLSLSFTHGAPESS